jgi:uncharacterized surface protein with fasciclin (FAS1) repeats
MSPRGTLSLLFVLTLALASCQGDREPQSDAARVGGGSASIADSTSQPDVTRIAIGSPDHTTLVAALKAADLVDVMSTVGPFTVFAPTNAAFDKLPAGTVEELLKPENKSKLARILQHHVTTSALELDFFNDGQSLNMVPGTRVTITRRDGATYVGGAKVIASVRASNGWVHVIDTVLLPDA